MFSWCLQGNRGLVKSGYALDYYYVDIHSEELDIEESGKCSMWVLRGSSGVQSLLQSSYCAQMVPNTLFTIVLDYSCPWRLKQSLEGAIHSIQSIIEKLQISQDILGIYVILSIYVILRIATSRGMRQNVKSQNQKVS